MYTERRKGRRGLRPGFRIWYAVKDVLAILGGGVLVHVVFRVLEANWHATTGF